MMNQNKRFGKCTGPVRVGYYVRIRANGRVTKEHDSLRAQVRSLDEYLEGRRQSGRDWIVSERLIETAPPGSRKTAPRGEAAHPARGTLLDLAVEGRIDVVVVAHKGVIASGLIDFFGVANRLLERDVLIVSVREKIDLTTLEGLLRYELLRRYYASRGALETGPGSGRASGKKMGSAFRNRSKRRFRDRF